MRLEAVTCDALLRWHYAVIKYNVTMLISPNQLWNFSKDLGMQRNERKIHALSRVILLHFLLFIVKNRNHLNCFYQKTCSFSLE